MCILHIVFCTVCKYVLSICKLLLLFCTVCPYVNCLLFFCTVCPYVNCCCFFCTVWSTVNAPVLFFCTVCPYVNCLLFFLHCLSICKLSVVFLHCLEHAHKNFTHQGTCAVVMWQKKWFDLIWFVFEGVMVDVPNWMVKLWWSDGFDGTTSSSVLARLSWRWWSFMQQEMSVRQAEMRAAIVGSSGWNETWSWVSSA